MNLGDLIDTVIEDLDEVKTNIPLRDRVKKIINRGYKELAKREGKELPPNLVKDTDLLLTNEKNIEFIINYAKWLYYLADQDNESAGIFKGEYEGFKIYSPKNFSKMEDTYGGGYNV